MRYLSLLITRIIFIWHDVYILLDNFIFKLFIKFYIFLLIYINFLLLLYC